MELESHTYLVVILFVLREDECCAVECEPPVRGCEGVQEIAGHEHDEHAQLGAVLEVRQHEDRCHHGDGHESCAPQEEIECVDQLGAPDRNEERDEQRACKASSKEEVGVVGLGLRRGQLNDWRRGRAAHVRSDGFDKFERTPTRTLGFGR